MKIGIISDTHDNAPALDWIISYLNQHNISTAFHAGDLISPGNLILFEKKYHGELHFVFGNNDGERAKLAELAQQSKKITLHRQGMNLTFEHKRIFMHHYSSIGELMAQSGEFDLVIGGHDHTFRVKEYGDTLFVNPGSTTLLDAVLGDRSEKDNGFVILDLETMEHVRVMVGYRLS